MQKRNNNGNGTSRAHVLWYSLEIGNWRPGCTVGIMKTAACVCVVGRAGRWNAQDRGKKAITGDLFSQHNHSLHSTGK